MKFGEKRFLPTAFVVASASPAITATATAAFASTAATTTITTVSATASTAVTTATAVLLWSALFGLINAEVTTHEVGPVHFFDCFASEIVVSESDEGESAWAVGFAVKGDEEVFDGSVSGECFTNVIIRSSERQIAEVQFHSL